MAEIGRYSLISERECIALVSVLDSKRSDWLPNKLGCNNYFTLGRCVYLDLSGMREGKNSYYKNIEYSNKLLLECFPYLYKKLIIFFSNILNDKISYHNNYAMPGFHIFYQPGIDIAAKEEPHVDLQHMRVNWKLERDKCETISFTIPLELPRNKGGLDVWFDGHKHTEEPIYHEYNIGNIFVQKGVIVHRIANTYYNSSSDRRITIQGHLIKLEGIWYMYW
ncbi:hypothetical protein AB6H46_21125 [Vibrio alginolyticus]|uniref:hypothetical protein n=1 Tax=Vibrio alginolyticus TaxID=663 RepID=UPI00354DC33C